MRNKIGFKKIFKLRKQTGLDIIAAMTRGGTRHRIDLFLRDGSVYYIFPGERPTLSESRHSFHTDEKYMETFNWEARKRGEETPAELLECPKCGYLIIDLEADLARYNFVCPRCESYTFKEFRRKNA